MSTVAAQRVERRVPGRRSLAVALALGRVEGRKLLRHPAAILGACLSAAAPVAWTWNDAPVLNRTDGLVSETLIAFGCGILVAAHLATMRARRHRTTELFDSVVSSDAVVTAGHLVAVTWAAGFALVLSLAELGYMKAVGGVTDPRPAVVLLGPALVAFGGWFGVALGRYAPFLFAAPIGLAAIVALCTAVTTNTYAHDREWLSLWVPSEFLSGVATETSLRPHGPRLAYVVALGVLMAAVAAARHRRPRPVAVGLALVALAGCMFAGRAQMNTWSREEQLAFADALVATLHDRRCSEHASVVYCPMDGYESWIERWRAPVEGVLAAIPAPARPQDLEFHQVPTSVYDDDRNKFVDRRLRRAWRSGLLAPAGAIKLSGHWGRHGTKGKHELALALAVAGRVTGIDPRFRVTEEDVAGLRHPRRRGWQVGKPAQLPCTTLEQGRSIVALWLAAQSTPVAEVALRDANDSTPYVAERSDNPTVGFDSMQWVLDGYLWEVSGDSPFTWGTRETAYAVALLGHDEADVRAELAANWTLLTDRATTSDEAAALLGLTPLVPLEDAVEEWKFFRDYRDVNQFAVQCH